MELFFMMTAMLALLVPIIVGRLRRALLAPRLSDLFNPIAPTLSAPERVAIVAGAMRLDADLFPGKPAWSKLPAYRRRSLSAEGRQFLDRTGSSARAGQQLGHSTGPVSSAAGAISRAESTTLANFTRLTDALVKVDDFAADYARRPISAGAVSHFASQAEQISELVGS